MKNQEHEKILVCCHKPCEMPEDSIYLPIQVGKSISQVELGIQGDNNCNGEVCDNVSELNGLYSEMTAAYWAWKNIKSLYRDIDYVGICHYRRYFYCKERKNRKLKIAFAKMKVCAKILLSMPTHISIFEGEYIFNSCNDEVLKDSNKRLKEMIHRYDITATKPVEIINATVWDMFCVIGKAHLELMEQIIKSDYEYYYSTFMEVVNGNIFSSANMIIMKYDLFLEYSDFIFGALDKHVKAVRALNNGINPVDDHQYSRVPGYLAEILTYVFIKKSEENKKSVLYTEKAFIKK